MQSNADNNNKSLMNNFSYCMFFLLYIIQFQLASKLSDAIMYVSYSETIL